MRRFHIGKRYKLIVIMALASFALLVTIINAGAIKNQLNDWKLLPQPERLTELYYIDHAKLSTTYLPGIAQSYGFEVHNLEYRDTTYTYQVVAQSEDGSQSLKLTEGSFSLKQDESKKFPVSVIPPDLGHRMRIITVLHTAGAQPTTENIFYWVTSIALSTSPAEAQ